MRSPKNVPYLIYVGAMQRTRPPRTPPKMHLPIDSIPTAIYSLWFYLALPCAEGPYAHKERI